MVLPTLRWGGAERHLITLAEELTSLDVCVAFSIIRAEGDFLSEVPSEIQVVPLLSRRMVRVLTWHAKTFRGGSFLAQFGIRLSIDIIGGAHRRLRRLCNRYRPDVILSSLWEADVIVSMGLGRGPPAKRPRWVVAGEYDFERMVLRRRFGRGALSFLRSFYRRADAFVAPSSEIKRQLKSLGMTGEVPVWTIPNAIPIERVRSLGKKEVSVRLESSKGPLIVALGRLDPQKGFDVLLDAFAKINREVPKARLVILGDGPLKSVLTALAKALRLDSSVTFTGFVQNPYAFMVSADLVVVPSRWEPFGNVVAEAMALGKAVISTRCGGPVDMISDREDGVLVDVDDSDGLARAILELIVEPHKRQKMGERAREKAERMFDATEVAKRYRDCLETLF